MVFIGHNQAQELTANQCKKTGNWLQILGSGGPELDDGRTSTSYLIWLDGKSRLLIDTGAGSHHNFSRAKADFNQLTAVLFSHLHVDHSNDLPAFIKSSFFTGRKNDLLIFGPEGNQYLPAMDKFINRLFSKQGVWPYLSNHLTNNSDSYQIIAKNIDHMSKNIKQVYEDKDVSISAIGVNHGPLPALAWKVTLKKNKHSIVFSGDTSANSDRLIELSKNAQTLLAHNAISEQQYGVARKLHMPPSRIAQVAKQSNVKRLILSHRMKRTNLLTDKISQDIKKVYDVEIIAGEDMQCIPIE